MPVCLYSLLKKVSKEHLKEDFDSLFKHLSSNEKTVKLLILTLGTYFLDFCSVLKNCHVVRICMMCSFSDIEYYVEYRWRNLS